MAGLATMKRRAVALISFRHRTEPNGSRPSRPDGRHLCFDRTQGSGLLNEIVRCEVCGNQHLRSVLDLGDHPMCDDLVPVGDGRRCREYPIEILFCDTCVTAHQRFQIPKAELFPVSYHYRSRHTADVLNGMKQLVAATEHEIGELKGRLVLDIGCNDGSLLSFFRERGASTYGIEPTGAARDAAERGHTVVEDFFGEEVATSFRDRHGSPDVISFTNVFAHIEDLGSVTRALKILATPKTLLVIENHYLGSILAKHQFDTFYHEHPRTYSSTSFAHIAEALGMSVFKIEFPQRYGGNIRVFMRSGAPAPERQDEQQAHYAKEASFGDGLSRMASQIEKWKVRKRAELEAELAHGRIEAKAFPGRAAIPLKLLGLDEKTISSVYEKPGSNKIGHYVPATRIPIRSDDEFSPTANKGGTLLNLAWHISDEIKTYMRGRGYEGRIIDIISQDDFDEER
jgi:hypothetical protein